MNALRLAIASEEMSWVREAACREADPDLFFPSRGETIKISQAKAICRECPVRVACLDYAVEAGERFGVWGGTCERERRRIWRRRRQERGAA